MRNDDFDFSITKVNNVIERPYTSDWNVKNLCFEKNYVMVMTLGGEADYEIESVKKTTKKNDVLLFPPGNIRSGRANPSKPWHFISVNFDIDFLESQDTALPLYAEGVSALVKEKFVALNSSWTGKNTAYKLKCRALIEEILYEIIVQQQKKEFHHAHFEEIETAMRYIQENYSSAISIKELARMSSLSPSYFRKIFRDIVGMSAMQYVTSIRLNKAKDLLCSGEVNVTEAALLSGFKDIFYFSALFKKTTGYSPSQILKK